MKVLMVLTSHDKLGNTGKKTGFWLEELAAPYYVLQDAGIEITLASPKGGQPPLDPKSDELDFQTDLTRRFKADEAANVQLAETVRLDSVNQRDFDAVFYPGGHGPLWDLAEDPNSINLIESFITADKPLALVCHAPGTLRHVVNPDGTPFVQGRYLTGFTNGEEAAVGLTNIVPFLVEDELIGLGAVFSKVRNWGVHTVVDGQLITGQSPHSSAEAAEALVTALHPSQGRKNCRTSIARCGSAPGTINRRRMNMKVFVIGVTGGVGRRVADLLVARGDHVDGLVRSSHKGEALAQQGISTTPGDLVTMSVDQLAEALRGFDAVVFAAGAGGKDGPEATDQVDGDGPAKLAASAKLADVRRMVLVSVFPEAWRERHMDRDFEHYMVAKKRAETQLVLTDLDWVILRPSALTNEPGTGQVDLGLAKVHEEVRRDDVAATVVEVLRQPNVNRIILEVTGGSKPIEEAVTAMKPGRIK